MSGVVECVVGEGVRVGVGGRAYVSVGARACVQGACGMCVSRVRLPLIATDGH